MADISLLGAPTKRVATNTYTTANGVEREVGVFAVTAATAPRRGSDGQWNRNFVNLLVTAFGKNCKDLELAMESNRYCQITGHLEQQDPYSHPETGTMVYPDPKIVIDEVNPVPLTLNGKGPTTAGVISVAEAERSSGVASAVSVDLGADGAEALGGPGQGVNEQGLGVA